MTAAIQVGDVTLHVRAEGPPDGPAVVFSNSLGTDFRIWDPILPLLPPGLRIVRYDKRGHGLSSLPEGPWTIADHVADLAGLMDALGLRDAAVVGLSVGGLIAQGLAATRPDLIRVMVLADTGAKIGNDEMWNERIERIRADGIEAMAEGILERWFTRDFREGAASYPLWRNMLIRTPRMGYVRTAEAIRDCDHRAATAKLTLPTLAIVGDQDGATPPDLVRETAALIAQSRFEVIADAGHLPCIEQPEETARLIGEFLGDTGHL